MSKALYVPLKLSLGTVLCLSANPVLSQVTSDGTVNTQVNQNGNVSEITGGATRESNLFHSFQDFSVQTGNEAFFNNNNAIENIFSRVTGGNISNIDGLIRANGNASLFLINPAGIIFGENARLDIGGSFYGSTASSILFDDGEFSAVNNLDQPILTVNAPIGLGFRDNPGEIINNSIANNGRGLEVASGNTISLLGGNIRFNGGRVTAPQGIVNLGGVSAAGEITIEDNNFSLPEGVERGNIAFVDNAIADIGGDGGGRIEIATNNLTLTGESLLLASIPEDMGEEDGVAGTVTINANVLDFTEDSAIVVSSFGTGNAGTVNITAEDISFDNEWSGIYANLGLSRIATDELVNNAVGNGGEININTANLSLTNGARTSTNSVGMGNAGNININATGEVFVGGFGQTEVPAFGGSVLAGINSQVQFEGEGNGGEINLEADSLQLDTGGGILADNDAIEGDAGNIQISLRDNFSTFPGFVLIQTSANNTQGNAGNITITANSFASNGLQVLADNSGQGGDGGNIDLDIEDNVSLNENSLLQTSVKEGGVGNAGDINITANSFVADNDSSVTATTEGQGNAGNIAIAADESISLKNGSQIGSSVTSTATGNGGDIFLDSGELNLTDSLIISNLESTDTNGGELGQAGNINIDISGDINLDNNSQIQSQIGKEAESDETADQVGVGNAGNITINAGGSFISTSDSQVLAGLIGTGEGGNIQINAAESIELKDGSLIFANIDGQSDGDAGSISLTAGQTFIITESAVLSQIQQEAQGNAGEININANNINISDFSHVSANSKPESSGEAGDIQINGKNIAITNGAVIDATTGNNSAGGNIQLDGNNLTVNSGGVIVTSAEGIGNAGTINLNFTGNIIINGSGASPRPEDVFPLQEPGLNELQLKTGLFANSSNNSIGKGGDILISNSGELIVSNTGIISVDSQGEGNAGLLTIDTTLLQLDEEAKVSANTRSGVGGNINLIIDDTLSLDNNSIISTQASDNGDGGNINIDTQFIIAFPRGSNDILANAEQGQGGNINIIAESLFGIKERSPEDINNNEDFTNDIDASSEFSLDGNVTINTPDLNPVQGTTELPTKVVDLEQTTAKACGSNPIGVKSGLTITGRGRVPAMPDSTLKSFNVLVNGEFTSAQAIPAPIQTSKGKIQPARGIKVTESGGIMLTAYRTNNAGERITETRNCR